ncbi:MAG: cysteine hydrolase family protein [Pseudomonadota bacterium]
MIRKFENDAALLLIDVQVGVNDFAHWGGPTGRRNNPEAEDRQRDLLAAFRASGLPVFFTRHDSREAASPLKFSLASGAQIEGLEPRDGEVVIEKDVNSGFIGTGLEVALRRAGVRRLIVGGFFTNFCVETTVRMAGNMGFDVYLAEDACATTNRVGPDGADHDPELVHALSVASMHGEFCTALSAGDVIGLTNADAPDLQRSMGNE